MKKDKENELKIDMEIEKVSLVEISYKDEKKGIDTYGRLIVNDDGKLKFEGDVEESARIFFEECLKPMCEKYIKELLSQQSNQQP
ncbi:hypothetical protein KAR91_41025 [Candidatus Pacearchaeota archaeon]|nr:hypothetical protein [Candidatus Pacearchaeota archaeon]